MKRFNSKQAEGYTPYTCIQALRRGSAVTRLSALVLGLGNMLNGQLIKGLLFLAGELAYIFFMIRYGFHNLVMLVTLGSVEQQEIWDEANQVFLYGELAGKVRESFVRQFWMEDKGYLKDLVSGTKADEQIRCNQIWAVSMPFTMLEPRQEKQAVQTVFRHLYTPVGLRTLSPEDAEFHPTYGGPQQQRDLAYHQGTVWPFPLGAWYLAYLKVNEYSAQAKRQVKQQLAALEPALREGCAGQLPEIYDGENPTASRGCFAQAWSVGELLRVYEALESPQLEH